MRKALLSLASWSALIGGAEFAVRRRCPDLPPLVPELSASYLQYLSQLQAPRFAAEPSVPPLPKPPGVRHVICLGESTAAIGDFEKALSARLASWRPDVRWRVVNGGIGGADIEAVERAFDESFALQPDLLVVYFGHNAAFRHRRLSPWQYRLGRALQQSFLLRRLAVLLQSRAPAADDERRLADAWERMAGKARAAGVPVVLCLPAGNFLHAPDLDRSVFVDRRLSEAYGRGLFLLESSGDRAVADYFLGLSRRRPEIAVFHYFRGRALLRLGRRSEALRELEAARDLDPSKSRATSRTIAVLRSVAREHSLPLADVEARFTTESRPGVPGFELFRDNCHPWPRGYRLIADEIVRALARGGGPAVASAPPGPPLSRSLELTELRTNLVDSLIIHGGLYNEEAEAYAEEGFRLDGRRLVSDLLGPGPDLKIVISRQIARTMRQSAQALSVGRIRSLALIGAGVAARRAGDRASAARLFDAGARTADDDIRALADLQRAVLSRLQGRDADARRFSTAARAEFPLSANDPWYFAGLAASDP